VKERHLHSSPLRRSEEEELVCDQHEKRLEAHLCMGLIVIAMGVQFALTGFHNFFG